MRPPGTQTRRRPAREGLRPQLRGQAERGRRRCEMCVRFLLHSPYTPSSSSSLIQSPIPPSPFSTPYPLVLSLARKTNKILRLASSGLIMTNECIGHQPDFRQKFHDMQKQYSPEPRPFYVHLTSVIVRPFLPTHRRPILYLTLFFFLFTPSNTSSVCD